MLGTNGPEPKTTNRPKFQHWVPQFYLKKFATPETRSSAKPKTWVFAKDSDFQRGTLSAVAKVCGQNYLYSPTDDNGTRDWSVEDYLGKLESDAGQRWPALIDGHESLAEPGLRLVMARFIAAMQLRNVHLFNLNKSVVTLRNKLFGPPTPEDLAARTADLPDPRDPTKLFVHALRSDTFERMVGTLDARRWMVLCVDREFFITSDMPVIFLPNNQGKAGPGASGSNAIFPLSPRRLLVMFDLDEALRQEYVEVDPSAERLRVFNRELLNRSLRFAFSSNEQPEPTAVPA